MARIQPPAARVALGLLAAALAAALPTLLLVWVAPMIFPIAVMVTLAHAFILALPAYLVLRRWFRINYGNAAALGLLVGAVPVPMYVLVSDFVADPRNLLYNASAERLLEFAEFAGLLGVLGGLGGLAFRRVIGAEQEVAAVDPAVFE